MPTALRVPARPPACPPLQLYTNAPLRLDRSSGQERDKFNKERDAAKLGDEALGKERDELRRDKQRLEGELAAAKALADKVGGAGGRHSREALCARCTVHAAPCAKQAQPL